MQNKNTFKDNESYLNYYRKYRAKNAKKFREYNKKYNREWRKKNGYHNEINSRLRYPEKEQARRIVQAAVRSGFLVKGNCEVCGDAKSQAHHEDYSKPLEVMWLCALHHKEKHKKVIPNSTF